MRDLNKKRALRLVQDKSKCMMQDVVLLVQYSLDLRGQGYSLAIPTREIILINTWIG